MKTQKSTFYSLVLLLFIMNVSQAQNVIPAAGGSSKGSGGSISYTVGQIVYTTVSSAGGSVAQGVQQPYQIQVVSGIDEKGIDLQCLVYPNPANEFLKLKVENYNVGSLRYQLYDIDGKLVKENILEGNETTILMESLRPAAYFLKVIDNNQEVKTFKIIKN